VTKIRVLIFVLFTSSEVMRSDESMTLMRIGVLFAKMGNTHEWERYNHYFFIIPVYISRRLHFNPLWTMLYYYYWSTFSNISL